MTEFFKSATGILNTRPFARFTRKATTDNTTDNFEPTPLGNIQNENSNNLLAAKTKQLRKIFRGKFLFVIIVAVLAFGLLAVLYLSGKRPSQLVQQSVQQSIQVNKAIEFPVRDQKGTATDKKLSMRITTADKTKQILIQGKPATARTGKSFLILNLELDNPTQNKLGLSPVELIRLVDASDKKYAPDVHNDKVSIEPLSTKRTRVGFVIDETVNGFNIQIGEVSAKKETVTINFN